MKDSYSKQSNTTLHLRTHPTYHVYLWNSYTKSRIRKNPWKRGLKSFLLLIQPNYVLMVGGNIIRKPF